MDRMCVLVKLKPAIRLVMKCLHGFAQCPFRIGSLMAFSTVYSSHSMVEELESQMDRGCVLLKLKLAIRVVMKCPHGFAQCPFRIGALMGTVRMRTRTGQECRDGFKGLLMRIRQWLH